MNKDLFAAEIKLISDEKTSDLCISTVSNLYKREFVYAWKLLVIPRNS